MTVGISEDNDGEIGLGMVSKKVFRGLLKSWKTEDESGKFTRYRIIEFEIELEFEDK